MTDIKRKLWVGAVLMFSLVMPLSAFAQDIRFTPRLGVTGEYNDNILFLRNDRTDDFILSLAPALELGYTTESLALNSLAGISFRRYLSEDDYDREDYYVYLNGTYRMTEKMTVNGRFNYIQDYAAESRIVDLAEPDVDFDELPVDPGIETFFSERKYYRAWAGMQYRLTEISELGVKYRYLRNDYDLEENNDYDRNVVDLTYFRALNNQRDRIGPRLGYTYNDSDISEYDSYNLALAWHHLFTETLSLYTDIGVRYTEESFKDSNVEDDDWGGTANIWLTKRGETRVLDLGFSHDIGTASNGRAVNVSRLFCRLNQFITERLYFDFKGNFFVTNEDNYSNFDDVEIFLDVIPSLRYQMTEDHAVRLAYSYTIDYDRSLEDDRDRHRNRVWVMFEFGFPNTL